MERAPFQVEILFIKSIISCVAVTEEIMPAVPVGTLDHADVGHILGHDLTCLVDFVRFFFKEQASYFKNEWFTIKLAKIICLANLASTQKANVITTKRQTFCV